MAASNKYGEAYDAEYVDKMMGKVLVQACAAVALHKPQDPIEYLSLWLHKYCDNAIILQNYEREKTHKAHKEIKEKEAIMKKAMIEQELRQQQNSTLNYMRSITNDPYLLWDTCLRAITTYTGCQAAYVCVIVRKIFEPKPEKKKKTEGEEGEENEEEEPESEPDEGEVEGKEGSDTTSVDEDPPEADEDKLEREEGPEAESEPELEEEEEKEAGEGGEEGEEKEPPPPKPFRIPKPLNYKNRRVLYVSATSPTHKHMLNRQMVIKSVPVTFSLLIEGLPYLHIPNVLYKEGIHYFGGCPRVGAYFVAPMTIEYIAKKYLSEDFKERPPEMFDIVKQKQVIALLCCDTLKSNNMGNGRPFCQIELDFFRDCANTMSSILEENNKEIKNNHNTLEVIEKFKEKLREIKLARVEQMEIEIEEAGKRKKTKDKLGRLKRFQVAHKAWEERQEVKARAQARLERQKIKKIKKLEEAGEEVPEERPSEELFEGEEVEDDDLEPILEPDPEEKALLEGEEALEEPPELELEEGEEWEEGEEKKDEFNDEELEPNPLAEIEGEGGEEALIGEEEEPEETEEPEEEEPPPEEASLEGEEGTPGKPKESEDMIKLKGRKKAHEKKEKEIKKEIKGLTKLVKGFEKKKKKTIVALEKLTVEVEKYERALFIANGVVQYLRKHMENAYNLLVENKLSELERVKRWPYPNRHVQRILKALLHLLGHKKMTIDDWNSARKLFNSDLLDNVLKNYDPLVINDPDRWKDVDSYLMGLKDEKLPDEACIGFLLQQWLLACKKTTAVGVNYHKIKIKYEELSKEYATLEMEKIMCEVETGISDTKLKKMVMDEEDRIEKEVDEIEAEEKRLADLAAEEVAKEEEENKMYAEYAAQAEIEAAEAAAAAVEGGEEGG